MAETTTHVIAYQADIRDVKSTLAELQRLNAQLADQLGKDFANASRIISQSVDKIKIRQVIDPKTGKQTSEVLGQMSTVFKDTAGNVKTFNQSVKQLNDGSFQTLNSTLRDGGKISRTFGDEIATLAKRAVLTIPIWLALRGAIVGLFKVVTDGFKNFVAFDRALEQIKRNLQGTPSEIEASLGKVRTEITATSIALGVSTEKIADAVKQFATLGFNTEDSLAGGIGATKLATVLFGDAGETAEAFAGSLNLLIDKSKGAKSSTDQMNEAFALVAELGKTNKDSIKGTAEGLKNFGGTAKSLGLTTKETITILATLSSNLLEGAKGGTLASSAFQQLVNNLSKVAGVLGISVNPQVQSTTEIFTNVIDEIEKLGKTEGIEAQTRAINELFGGLKGAKPVRALIADLSRLKENFKISGDVAEFNKAVADVTGGVSAQTERFTNLNKEIGKAFITGLVGGEDFADSLREINNVLESVQKGAQAFGASLVSFSVLAVGGPFASIFFNIQKAKKEVGQLQESLLSLATQGVTGKLSSDQLKQTIKELQINADKGKIVLDPHLLPQLSKQLEKQINDELKDKNLAIQAQADATVKFNDIALITTKEEQNIRKLIVEDQLAQAKAAGATASEILKTETSLNRQLNIYEEEDVILKRQLETQQALTAERRLQNKLGSDSIKLFEIAQSSGTGIAQQIGDVLAGNVDFSSFVQRGGEALDVFKKEFADIFKQQQAQAFFQGNSVPGAAGLTGGASIPIEEQALRQALTQFSPQAQLALSKAQGQIPTIRNDITARIEMSVNVQNLSFREAIAKIKDEMAKEILNPNSELGKATTQRIEEF